MSLKGSELARDAAVLARMKDEWESYGKSAFEARKFSTDEYGFDVFLCGKITDLQTQAAAQTCATNKWKRQRDLAFILCAIFFVIAMLFAFRPATEGNDAVPVETQAEATVSFAEWTRRQKAEYIASSESDKYHRRSCKYVENILDENRIYYVTATDAERDGKTACSLCRPHDVTITQKSTQEPEPQQTTQAETDKDRFLDSRAEAWENAEEGVTYFVDSDGNRVFIPEKYRDNPQEWIDQVGK